MRLLLLPIFALALFSTRVAAENERSTFDAPQRPPTGWLYFDAPVWDIADEGLPFRFTLALPSRRDPLARLILAAEARWTVSVGYAKVYNSYDGATGVFKNPGGHAALFSAGRQYRWTLPRFAGALTPTPIFEIGGHVATRNFPADGTRANFKVISGFEWAWRPRRGHAEWSAALIWPHFSNGNLFSRNAGYDGLALRIGRSIRF